MRVLTILFLGVFLFTDVSFAERDGKKFMKGEFLKKELNLTDEQLEKVREIRKSGKDKIKDERKNFRKLKTEFHEAMKDPKISNQELQAKFNSFKEASDRFQRRRFETILKMREILSPEQLKKYLELKKKHRGKWFKKKASLKKS